MKKTILTVLVIGCALLGKANNIQVSNVSLQNQNTVNHTLEIHFDVAWENSWRTSTNESNYDGAWIFVKFKKNGTYDWRHCLINPVGANPAPGATFSISNDSMGAFIYRSSYGIGANTWGNNKLLWDYGASNIGDNDSVSVKVFALEMVYIPTGSFYLGSGGNEPNCFRNGSTPNTYYQVNAGAIPCGNFTNQLNFNVSVQTVSAIPATFPTGYDAFWIMKYECSQQQYADFLNLLNSNQAGNPLIASPDLISNNFQGSSWPTFSPGCSERAIYWIKKEGFLSLADWSGLRPFSELEFEKACRGNNLPVANEYAWGSTNITEVTSISSPCANNDSVLAPANGNAIVHVVVIHIHPERVGLLARTGFSSRDTSGATYYGIMNMSDNVCEITVNPSSADGSLVRSDIHGDGIIDGLTGYSNVSQWNQVSVFTLRGGAFNTGIDVCRVSDRQNAGQLSFDYYQGIRLARTAQ